MLTKYITYATMQLKVSCKSVIDIASKEVLKEKLFRKPYPKNFTVRELDSLMSKCGCEKFSGGRGSSLKYIHIATKRILIFDGPHPGNELYKYQIEKVKAFIVEIGE